MFLVGGYIFFTFELFMKAFGREHSHSHSDVSFTFFLNTDVVVRKCFVKIMFLKISQNSQENTSVRVSFLISYKLSPATLLKKRLCHRCFPVNFSKFLKTAFFIEYRMLLFIPRFFLLIRKVERFK